MKAAGWPNRPAIAIGLLIATAALVTLPLTFRPMPLNDSHWINLVWLDQFTTLLREGHVWPRWLPASHDGLGAPVFYFYGPVAFWLTGSFALAGFDNWSAIVATAAAMLAMGGILAWLWLRQWATRPLVGALFFVVAPYHLLDLARRGALAEFVAIALLPALPIGVARAANTKPACLAIAYALLCMTHPPTAVLAGLLLMPMLLIAPRLLTLTEVASVAYAIALGIGLAAIYLLPAFLLQPETAIGAMRAPAYMQPASWTPTSLWRDAVPGLLLVGLIGLALGLISIMSLSSAPSWSLFSLLVIVAALGCLPPLWILPALNHVQFPWRILSLAELAAAAIVASTSCPIPRLLLFSTPTIILSALILTPAAPGDPRTIHALLRSHPDVIEYLPPDVGEIQGAMSRRAMEIAATTPPSSTVDGVTTLRRFAFPDVQIRCEEGIVSSWRQRHTGLLQYRGHGCHVERIATSAERIGTTVSLAAGLLLLLGSACSRFGRRAKRSGAFAVKNFTLPA
ncbi:hypothetical protein [Sphingomonas sp.]|uniref:hypothetical protein n=1 Tax=Sphingomonas sp. TaxID=28214 RepID=UPI000DB30CD7|nr:hypothetical protein [Sphingomonas sp.]PZU07534.1 MAG: hypothetical protein DI605_15870 [Sphingomonas sp.]